MSNDRSQQTKPVDWVRLSFESQSHSSGYVSATVISRTISAVDRLARLLTGVFHSDSNRPLPSFPDLTKEFENQYELVLGQTAYGSYVLPVSIRYRDGVIPAIFHDIDEPSEDLTQLTSYFDRVLIASTHGKSKVFEEIFPNLDTGLKIITAVRNVFPTKKEYWLKINTPSDDQALLDSRRDSDSVFSIQTEYRKLISSGLTHEKLNIIADIEAFNKIDGRFKARTIDGQSFEGSVQDLDSMDISILPNRIEIDGTFTLDGTGEIQSVEVIGTASEVESKEVEVYEFKANEHLLVADPPLTFQVSRLATDIYLLEGDLGVVLHAESENDVIELLYVVLEDMWVEYAQEENAILSDDGIVLKEKLLNRVRQK